jgi:hypothetical protein
MTTVEHFNRYLFSCNIGECCRGQNGVERSHQVASQSWSTAARGQGWCRSGTGCGRGRQTVYTWKGLLDEGGIDALGGVPERGRPS